VQKLERRLELSAVIAISISAMLGSGIFVLPGLAAGMTGPTVWLAYVLAGICVLPAALSKAELGTAMPTSGGSYVYLDRAFGPLAGTIAGLGLWLSLLLKSAFALVGFSAYLKVLAPKVPITPTALVLLVIAVVLNVGGVKKVSKAQIAVVSISLTGLAIIAGFGLFKFEPARLSAPGEGVWGLVEAIGFVFVSFAGVTKIAAIAEEVKKPERNLPAGILLSLGIVTTIYAAVAIMLVACIKLDVLQGDLRPIYTLAATVGGKYLGIPAAILGVLTMASMANAGLLAASRFPFAMGRFNAVPSLFSRLNPKSLTPVASVIATGAAMAAAILFFDVTKIAKLASAFVIMMFVAINLSVIVFRESGVQWYKPAYHSPFYPWIQLFGIVSGTFLLVKMGVLAAFATAVIVVLGLVVYVVYGRRHIDRRGVVGLYGRRKQLLQSEIIEPEPLPGAALSDKAAVVVALFGEERSPETLVEMGAALAEGGLIEVLYLTEVPDVMALQDIKEMSPRSRSIQRRIEAMAESENLRVKFRAIPAHDVIETVHHATSQLHCEWLVMQWGGRRSRRFTIRNPLGWLKDHVDCNLAVFADDGVRYIRKILVYVEPGTHDTLVASTADHLAALHGAEISFARHEHAEKFATETNTRDDYLEHLQDMCTSPTDILTVKGKKKARDLGRAGAAYDLILLPESPQRFFTNQILGTFSDRVTEKAACSVLRLQSPRGYPKEGFAWRQGEEEQLGFDFMSYLEERCIDVGLERMKKDALFNHFATAFADVFPAEDPGEIGRIQTGLWEREKTQNTAVGRGVAIPHATLGDATATHFGVFVTREPLDYKAPDGLGVDVFFVTIGAPTHRQTHLQLLAFISKMVLKTPLLEELRKASSKEEVVAALRLCSQAVDMDTLIPGLPDNRKKAS
jgi:amino acid transporter/mannitol/fructose-specific phosphotransferase system IIA component (Ntr-type)